MVGSLVETLPVPENSFFTDQIRMPKKGWRDFIELELSNRAVSTVFRQSLDIADRQACVSVNLSTEIFIVPAGGAHGAMQLKNAVRKQTTDKTNYLLRSRIFRPGLRSRPSLRGG